MKFFIPQRTQPPHIGHISMLKAASKLADHIIIGIGSANRLNAKNPYTAPERELMLTKSLRDVGVTNFSFIYVPDFDNDQAWTNYIIKHAQVDHATTVLSGNSWVLEIFNSRGYKTAKPKDVISSPLINISATSLRQMILDDDLAFIEYAASGTLHYFEKFGGKERIARFQQTSQLQENPKIAVEV